MGGSALYLVPRSRIHTGANGAPCPPCPACLPSSDAALRFVRDPSLSTTGPLLWTVAMRSMLVAAGLALLGLTGTQLLTTTLAAVGAIEVGVLVWAAWYNDRSGGHS